MKHLNYFLKGFGFENYNDFLQSCFKILYFKKIELVFNNKRSNLNNLNVIKL